MNCIQEQENKILLYKFSIIEKKKIKVLLSKKKIERKKNSSLKKIGRNFN